MRSLIVWGGTGHARVINELIYGTDFCIKAVIDNRVLPPPFVGAKMLIGENGLDYWLSENRSREQLFGVVAVGGVHGADRLALLDLFKSKGIQPATLVHRTAFVASDATLDEGSQVLAQASVCAAAKIGRGVIVNTAASVDHDTIVGDGSHLAPGVRIAGEACIGRRVFIGLGAILFPHITIGDDSIIGAGSIVTKSVPSRVLAFGNPARIKQ